MPYKEEF